MVVLFKNAEKGTYFFIDSVKGTANFVPYRAVNTFFVYKDYLELEVLTLPDYSTVQKFKRLIAKGCLERRTTKRHQESNLKFISRILHLVFSLAVQLPPQKSLNYNNHKDNT